MQAGPLIFSANFDSGNLAKVECVQESIEFTGPLVNKVPVKSWASRVVAVNGAEKRPLLCSKPDYHVKFWAYPDAHGTPFENGNRSWFYFSVRNYAPGSIIRLSIMNVSRQSRVFTQGYSPVYNVMNSVADEACWMRNSEDPVVEAVDGQNAVTFAHRFTDQAGSTTFFAFSYPWTYVDAQIQLRRLEDIFSLASCKMKTLSLTDDSSKSSTSIYFHRELLCYSLCGRRVDLLTISDHSNMLPELEERFDPLLFPESFISRPRKFANKKVFIITARVHPGETPGSHIFNGILEFLLRENDERAIQLRRTFVFKLVPMLNPDGVSMGHHRTDSRGVNLNRFYLQPNFLLYPAVYAVKALATYHHLRYGTLAPYPGHLPPLLFDRYVELSASYRCLAGSAEFSPHTGNLIRPPFTLKRKETDEEGGGSEGEKDEEKANVCNVAEELTRTLSAALEGKKPTTVKARRPRPNLRCASDKFGLFNSVESEQFLRTDNSEQAAPPSLHVRSENLSANRSASARFQQRRERRRQATIDICVPPLLSIHAAPTAKRRSFDPNEGSKKPPELLYKSPQGHRRSPNQVETARTKNNANENVSTLRPNSPNNENIKGVNGKSTIDASDDENEADSHTRKLDRTFLNMVAKHLKQDGQDSETKEAFLSYCSGAHLTHPSLLNISAEESGVKCYLDLHGHCTKRGCFCYGNRLKDERKMIDNVLYARLVAANSAFFDFGACNFSTRNMYLRDKVNDTTKEGSGRVGIWKHTGITHCYTVEANYSASRAINIISPVVSDERCTTPPGVLWGPLRDDSVVTKPSPASLITQNPLLPSSFFIVPTSSFDWMNAATTAGVGAGGASAMRLAKLTEHGSYVVSHEERYSLAHFHEMGRGLMVAALDMWDVNPWSRLGTSPVADVLRFRAGSYCNLKTLAAAALRFGKIGMVRAGGRIPTKLRQAEMANMRILRNWAQTFVCNTNTFSNELGESARPRGAVNVGTASPSNAQRPRRERPALSATAPRRTSGSDGGEKHRSRATTDKPATSASAEEPKVRRAVEEQGVETWQVVLSDLSRMDTSLMEGPARLIGDSGRNNTVEQPIAPMKRKISRHVLSPPFPPSAACRPDVSRRASSVKRRSRHKYRTKAAGLVLSIRGNCHSVPCGYPTPVPRLHGSAKHLPMTGAVDPLTAKLAKGLIQGGSGDLKHPRSTKAQRKRFPLPTTAIATAVATSPVMPRLVPAITAASTTNGANTNAITALTDCPLDPRRRSQKRHRRGFQRPRHKARTSDSTSEFRHADRAYEGRGKSTGDHLPRLIAC